MTPLPPYMAAIIILYQIPVHFFRDCCKIALYFFHTNINDFDTLEDDSYVFV